MIWEGKHGRIVRAAAEVARIQSKIKAVRIKIVPRASQGKLVYEQPTGDLFPWGSGPEVR
jgi:hypothetical protein